MNHKNKKGKRLTSTFMAVLLSVSTTLTPINSIASEMETSPMAVESTLEEITAETEVQTIAETTTSSEGQASASETQAITEETTAEADQPETENSVAEEVQSSGESAEETSANETRGPDEVYCIDLATATKEEILSYIEAIGGDESDAYYDFTGDLGEDEYDLVWMAQYGAEEDQLADRYGFEYDEASDLEICKYIRHLEEEELTEFVYSMTFEQYRRYLSIKEMMTEIEEKKFSDVIDEKEFTPDRTWEYADYDTFAETLTGVSLKRTDQTMQFYNTYVDNSKVRSGVTTIDGLLDSNADWYSNDYILSLDPELFKETVPVYYGSDGNYYAVSTVPALNGIESADYQPATNFYNDSVAAEAFTDIQYLGNGVYRIPGSRYQYCYTEQYVSDSGTLYGISFGLRIQVLYGFTASGEIKISADVLYPDMTERFLPAVLNLASGTATVKIFNDDYDDTLDKYLISASINRGKSIPDGVSVTDDGKTLQFVMGDNCAVGSLDILIGYNTTSKYSMAAQVTTESMYRSESLDNGIALTAELQGSYLKMDRSSVPSDLAVGDKFVYANTRLTITGVNNAADDSGTIHVGAVTVPTHDAQEFCLYNTNDMTVLNGINSWFKYSLSDANSASPGYLVQMTVENIQKRASSNGQSVNLGNQRIFGYLSDALGTSVSASGKTLNLEGTQVLLACMHAWNTQANTPVEIVNSVNSFTERTADQETYAHDVGYGHYYPNIALQCTDVHDGGDGYTYATFKVVTSMLGVRGVKNPNNYQCAFSTLNIRYDKQQGYLRIHKSSSDPAITNANSCYSFDDINYGVFTDADCVNNIAILNLDEYGYSETISINPGTYYIREATETPGSGYKTNGEVYTVDVTDGTTADAPVICETVDQPLNDPLGIQINKINGDGTTTADLSGAEYTITYYPKQYTSVAEIEADTDPEVKPTVWVIQTIKSASEYFASLDDEHIVPNSNSAGAVFGKTHVGNYIIPLGTITVEETKAPTGFTKDGAVVSSAKTGATISGTNNVYLFQLVDENSAVYLKSGNALSTSVDDETAITLTYAEVQNRAGIRIAKYDASTGGAPSGDADISGIKFAIVNNTGSAIVNYAGKIIEDGSVAQVVITDSIGYAATGANDLPVGSYIVRELRQDAAFDGENFYEGTSALANGSYQWQDNQDTVTLTDEDAGQLVWAKAFFNYPLIGVPVMEKHDLELNKKAAMGGVSFKGITFEIYNNSDTPVIINGTSYAKGEAVAEAVSDAEGNITTDTSFPIGRYSMKEKSVNGQYTMTEGETHYFNVISDNGEMRIEYEPGCNAVIFKDRVVRGDLSFIKKNAETGETLAYIPFKITNNSTGETHYILTDADGKFTSAAGKTTNTNANDKVLSGYGDKDVIPQSVIDSLTKDAGLWFGMGGEGTMTDANDSYGAFVYGTYTITELKTEATRSMKMYTNTFTIDTDGKVLDLGTVNNIPMGIKTTLVDVNGEHFAEATGTVTLIDHVAYKNLDTDKTYTLTGTLYVKEGDALTELMTETVDFQPTETNGTQDVTFTFDASALVGKSVVAFEELSLNGEFYAEHKDKNDENQTVVFPGLKTTARDSQTDNHVSNADDSITIIDTVEYYGLQAGKEYTITGTLVDQKTGKAVSDDDGNEITASKVLTATESNGSAEIEFHFAGISLAGKTVVAFEKIEHEGSEYAVHADLNDKNQTIYFPSVKTKATDKNTGLNQVKEDSNVTVVDTVTYTGLQPGKTYTMTGMLMSSSGNVIISNGKRITAGTEFTPSESNGSVDVVFNFDASGLDGRQYVFFEYLYLDGVRVAAHTDISDTNQIIYIPSIKTTLIDSENGSHSSAADQDITLIDTVRYNGVEIGRKYTVTGTLVDKTTGKEITDDTGNKITASAEFTAEKMNGTIDVSFTFSGVSLAGKMVVAYEHMYTEGIEVAVHADLRDEGQTEYFPSVHTTATSDDTEDHVTGANEKVTITDQVELKALKPGTEYTLSGTLMNAKTGKPVVVNGAAIIARRTFTADAHEMTIPLIYELNASELAGTATVVFENLYSDGALLASHADLKDVEQTVYIPEIHTSAKDKETQINHTESNEKAAIIDTVSYTNLLPGKEYTMTGTLMDQETGKSILVDGKEITASTTFTAETPEGSADVIFTFDATIVAPKTVVAFENLTYKGIQIAVHTDIEDEAQTVYIPKIRTNAISDDTKNHVVEAKKDITIIDTVSYEGLEIGREYTVKGTLMDQKTKEALKADGKEVTAGITFTAEAANGTVDVTFVFDGTKLEDTVLVAYEHMYSEGKEVAVHADIKDTEQTVYIPKIRTHAQDAVTDIDHTEALENATIIDTVTYSSLLPGKEYTIKGTLMNKETGEAVLLNDEPITAETTFTAEKSSGSVELTFTFDASAITGTTVVAFESMKYDGIEVAVHTDIEDEDQTVYIPDVYTTATALDTREHVTGGDEDMTITDEVVLTGLKIGKEYTVKGVLMDKSTKEELKVNGESIFAEETFVADAADMTVTLTYTLDASKLAGTTTVVYETLYTDGKEVGRHHEINDEGQTVYIPEIHTTAVDHETGINHTESNEQATIIDTVYYSHLLVGKEYTVHGVLVDQKTEEPILVDGEEITASTTFTAEASEGSVDVIFTFDATIIAPRTVVAFESMEYEGIEIAVHADIDDENQTVYLPQIHTTAVGEDTQDHIEKAKEEAVIVDTVYYDDLEIGREYTIRGILVDKQTGEPILVNGEKVTAEETFAAESQEGSIDITFTINTYALAGKSLVAFESLYTEEKEVAAHADITDEGQTVHIPEIHTTATDKVTGDHDGVVDAETTVLDEVFYTNLLSGKEYTVKGTLMVKETGEPLTVAGKEVTAEKTFIAEESDGSIVLEFTFNSSALAGKKVVAFEDVTYEGISIGSHEDLMDEDQTITYPKLYTTAANSVDGSKTMTLGTSATLTDTVSYKGLTTGKTYVLKGTIMDKANGQSIGVMAETTFTAEMGEGSAVVTFTFDTTVLQGKTLVVFESLYDVQGSLIAGHSDLNDEDQTVVVPIQPEIPPVVTGDDSSPVPYMAGLAAALMAAIAALIMLFKRKRA